MLVIVILLGSYFHKRKVLILRIKIKSVDDVASRLITY